MTKQMLKPRGLVILAMLGVMGGFAWWQREPLLARYSAWQRGGADRESTASLLATLGDDLNEEKIARYRPVILEALQAADTNARTAAMKLVIRTSLRGDAELLRLIVPLLKDSAAVVRKAAIIALGPARETVSDEVLLPLLHDTDDEVQNLCELALQSRGLTETHILLARLISDERPSARLQVLQHLREANDLDMSAWLQRLCQDPAPAVRAAAIRAAAGRHQVDLRPALYEMSQNDPSPTVRQLAGHYLNRTRVLVRE